MPKIILVALTCFVFMTGCQSAPETESKPAAPAAAEVVLEVPVDAAEAPTTTADAAAVPEVSTDASAASQGEAGEQETAPAAESAGGNMELQTALAHHNFVLESVDGQEFTYAVPEGAEMVKPNLSFAEWPHASGKICNTFRGQAELEGDTLYLRNAASTMMLCFAEEVNKFEGLFHQMLRDGVKVAVEGQTLTLTGGGHVLVFKLRDYVS